MCVTWLWDGGGIMAEKEKRQVPNLFLMEDLLKLPLGVVGDGWD